MKFRKTAINYSAKYNSFINFHELKCNLPDIYEIEFMDVKETFYPDNVTSVRFKQDNSHIFFDLFINTEFGEYLVPVNICLDCGTVTAEFESTVNQMDENEVKLDEKQFKKIVKICIPIIKLFLDNLDKIKRNHPCLDNCSSYKDKIKNGYCDEIYYVPKEEIVSTKEKK